LLFIGCSFEGPYLRDALSAMHKEIGYERAKEQQLFGPTGPVNTPRHFALLSPLTMDQDAKKRQKQEHTRSEVIRQLEEAQIRTIVCTKHCDIETILEDLWQTTIVVPPVEEPPQGG
jgi:hypothetical protein